MVMVLSPGKKKRCLLFQDKYESLKFFLLLVRRDSHTIMSEGFEVPSALSSAEVFKYVL